MTATKVDGLGELWKDVPGFEGKYQASTHGRVRSLDRIVIGSGSRKWLQKGQILKAVSHNKGYHLVTLSAGAGNNTHTIHSIVARTFLGPTPEGQTVNHKNGCKTDNHLYNLEYMTYRENNIHAIETGLRRRK